MILIFYTNFRSLLKFFYNITAFLNTLTTAPDILAVTETWLSDINKEYFQLSGYHSYHLVRDRRAQGGVSVDNKNYYELSYIYSMFNMYRPHSKYEAVEEFTDTVCKLLQKDNIKNNQVIIIGDRNINLLEHTRHNATHNYLAALQIHNFFPHISRRTRFPDSINLSEPSLLDHIYTNFNSDFISGIEHDSISDHLSVFINFKFQTKFYKYHKFNFRSLTQTNKQDFSNKISTIEWDVFLSEDDVNNKFDIFFELNEIYNESFPIITKTVSEKRLNTPWINQEVINAI